MARYALGIQLGRIYDDPELDAMLEIIETAESWPEAWINAQRVAAFTEGDENRYTLWMEHMAGALVARSDLKLAESQFEAKAAGLIPASVDELALILDIFHTWGYKARGTGYASEITEEGGREYERCLSVCIDALKTVDQLVELNPMVDCVRAQVAVECGGRELAAEILEGLYERYPLNLKALRIGAWGRQEKWGGKPGAAKEFALRAVHDAPGTVAAVPLIHHVSNTYWEHIYSGHGKFDILRIRGIMRVMKAGKNVMAEFGEELLAADAASRQAAILGPTSPFTPYLHQSWYRLWSNLSERERQEAHIPFIGDRFMDSEMTTERHIREFAEHRKLTISE